MRFKLLFVFIFFVLSFGQSLYSQKAPETKPKTSFSVGFSGHVMLSAGFDGKSLFYNMGGPHLKLSLSNKVALSGIILPTLQVSISDFRPLVSPTVGSGFLFSYDRYSLIAAAFWQVKRQEWQPALGLGYRFGK